MERQGQCARIYSGKVVRLVMNSSLKLRETAFQFAKMKEVSLLAEYEDTESAQSAVS